MIPPHQIHAVFFLLFALASFSIAARADTNNCNRSRCGSTSVSYPFGFSHGCPIRLNCSGSGKMQLGGYRVQNITSGSILLEVPPECNRSIAAAGGGLFGDHYAMTASNVLFLRNCSQRKTYECSINTDIISRRLNQASCGPKDDDISCLSSVKGGFLSKENFTVIASQCKFLFASVKYGEDGASKQTALVIGTAEIGWWLKGGCQCAANASCNLVDTPAGNRTGFRCSCHEGFDGDGFAHGEGCRRVSTSSASSSKSGNHGARVGIILGGFVAGATLAFGLAFLCCRIGRCCSTSKTEEATQRLLSESSCTVAVYSHKDVERATGNFSDAYKLGAGAYATVYMGKFSNSAGLVAIKRLTRPDIDNVEHVINEIKLVSSVSHPNLVRLLGCCIGSGEHILVYEFMPNGTLSQHLRRDLGDGLSWPARVSIATMTARAIAYLHTAVHPPIYHRDIKSSNILLDYDLRPKLADFGLSRVGMVESSHISTAPQGTPGYVDPQYHQNFHLSDKSDVYSFGVVLVEMITAMKVVDFRRAPTEVNLASLAVDKIGKGMVEDMLDPIIKENWDGRIKVSVQKVAELAFRCLAFHKEARPSMVEVAEELERIRMEECSSSARHEGPDGQEEETKSMRSVAEKIVAEKAEAASPVSVQEQWGSAHSCSSSASSSIASSRILSR